MGPGALAQQKPSALLIAGRSVAQPTQSLGKPLAGQRREDLSCSGPSQMERPDAEGEGVLSGCDQLPLLWLGCREGTLGEYIEHDMVESVDSGPRL